MTVESPGIGHRPSTSSTAVLFASPRRCGSARERAPLGAGALLVLLALGVAAPVDTLDAATPNVPAAAGDGLGVEELGVEELGVEELGVEELGQIVEAHRLRWPAFEVAYYHDLDAADEHPIEAAATKFWPLWTYANALPGTPEPTVRSSAETPATPPFADGEADRLTWMFDRATGEAISADRFGRVARISTTARKLEMGHEYEFFTGLAAMRSLLEPSRQDLVTAIRAGGAMLRSGTVEMGGYDCLVVDAPLDLPGAAGGEAREDGGEASGTPADRTTFYLSESLNYAVVAVESVLANRVESRRTASEFVEIAPGAPHLPLAGVLWLRDSGEGEVVQEIRVARDAVGAPCIRTGSAVDFTLAFEPGTVIRHLDTGVVRVVDGGGRDAGSSALAGFGLLLGSSERGTSAAIAATVLAAIATGFWIRRRRAGAASV